MRCLDDLNDFYDLRLTARSALSLSKGLPFILFTSHQIFVKSRR